MWPPRVMCTLEFSVSGDRVVRRDHPTVSCRYPTEVTIQMTKTRRVSGCFISTLLMSRASAATGYPTDVTMWSRHRAEVDGVTPGNVYLERRATTAVDVSKLHREDGSG